MRKADLAIPHRLDGLRQALQVLADGDHVSGGSAGLVTFKTNPLDRRDKSLLFVIRFGRKPSGHARSLQEQKIHLAEICMSSAASSAPSTEGCTSCVASIETRVPNIRSIVNGINPNNGSSLF